MKKHLNTILTALLFILYLHSSAQIKIVSGLQNEIYNQFAEDIKNNTNIPLKIYTTQGSVDNFNKLKSDSIQIAFIQYDVLLYKEIENSEIKNYIKIFLPLFSEEIHLIAKNNSAINSISDLKNKKVGVGSLNSGTNITARFMKLKTEINWIDYNIPLESSFSALLKDSIDAFFIVGAAPINLLKNLSKNDQNIIKLVPIENEKLNKIYIQKTISSKTYPWLNEDINTYATRTLLVVNTKNINPATEKKMDSLYNDLRENLKGIQKNKFSHPKWAHVDFSNLKNIDWPVYKEEYVTARLVFDVLAYVALLLTIFQIYFVLNKLLKRKHEKVVAESISVSAMFISILINCFFGFKNIMNNGLPQFSANIMWIVCSAISTIVGIGFWVRGSKEKGLWRLFKHALNLERMEAADLAKSFFRPSGADKIIEILGRISMIDNDLADEEKKFVQSFADEWGINIDWNFVETNFVNIHGQGFYKLRDCMQDYLATSPPPVQASQLADVITILINIDNVVAKEEELIQAELTGQINQYLNQQEVETFNALVIPQNKILSEEEKALLFDLKKENFAGGYGYVSEAYYSYKYAEVVCKKYCEEGFFAVVVQMNKLKNIGKEEERN